MSSRTLRRRLATLLAQWLAVFLVVWGAISLAALAWLRQEVLADRLRLARVVALHLESGLADSLRALERAASDLGVLDAGAAPRLRSLRFETPFRAAVWLLDAEGRLLAADPASATPPPGLPLAEHGLATGLLPPAAPNGRALVVLLEPFRRAGRAYVLAAALDPLDSRLNGELGALEAGAPLRLLVVDTAGRVIAAADRRPLLRTLDDPRHLEHLARRHELLVSGAPCLACGAEGGASQVSVLAPLRLAPWAVVLQEEEASAFRMPNRLRLGLLAAALLLAASGAVLAQGVSRSLVEPMALLAARARRLRDGDLATPVAVEGDRELEELAAALEAARSRLAATLGELEALNRGLEQQVEERTRGLRAQDAQRRDLVRRLLAAGEEERRRIGRELHDELSQLLTVVQLSLGRLGEDPGELAACLRHLAAAQLELHRVIHDLRPTVLDDLGLAAALGWYATHDLEPAGVAVSLEIDALPALPAEVEITAFRIYQEIVTNILKHARAEHVTIELYVRTAANGAATLVLTVEDDGVGFALGQKSAGLGLLGMQERATLVGGALRVDSEPGMGTHVVLEVPLA